MLHYNFVDVLHLYKNIKYLNKNVNLVGYEIGEKARY